MTAEHATHEEFYQLLTGSSEDIDLVLHLVRCRRCQDTLEFYRELEAAVDEPVELEPPDDEWDRIRAALARENPALPGRSRRGERIIDALPPLLKVAAIVVVLIGISVAVGRDSEYSMDDGRPEPMALCDLAAGNMCTFERGMLTFNPRPREMVLVSDQPLPPGAELRMLLKRDLSSVLPNVTVESTVVFVDSISNPELLNSDTVVAQLVATDTMAPLINLPVLALSPGGADGSTSTGGSFYSAGITRALARGSFGVGLARAMEMVSFGVAGGYLVSDTDDLPLSGAVAVHVLNNLDSPVTVSVQAGLGWIATEFGTERLTVLNFPVGVTISGSTEAGSVTVSPWVMPRVQFTRLGGTTSNTETDFGASAGVGFMTESGLGFGAAFDLLIGEDSLGVIASSSGFGAGVLYVLP